MSSSALNQLWTLVFLPLPWPLLPFFSCLRFPLLHHWITSQAPLPTIPSSPVMLTWWMSRPFKVHSMIPPIPLLGALQLTLYIIDDGLGILALVHSIELLVQHLSPLAFSIHLLHLHL